MHLEPLVAIEATLRVGVVGPHPAYRLGFELALRPEPELAVMWKGTHEGMLVAARLFVFDLIVADIAAATGDAISLVSDLRRLQPSCHILGVSIASDPLLVAQVLGAGVTGYALKTQPPQEILDAARQVGHGVRYIAPRIDGGAVDVAREPARPIRSLTSAEREILDLLVRGYTNDEIASKRFVSRRTVETHRLRITRKLGTRSIVEMCRIAATAL